MHYAQGHCAFHEASLPTGHLHRICCHFEAAPAYWHDNDQFMPPARRFTWFREDLKPGVLYLFSYNAPEKIE
ncbi:MAG: hypothetical protein ACRET0_16555, partial [Steroidobacteraceae bacterium]